MFLHRETKPLFGLLATEPSTMRKATLYIGNRYFAWERRTSGGLGRFGGGWEIKFGFQSGSLRKLVTLDGVIFNLFVASLYCGRQTERRNEATARALANLPPPSVEQARASAHAQVETISGLAKKIDAIEGRTNGK